MKNIEFGEKLKKNENCERKKTVKNSEGGRAREVPTATDLPLLTSPLSAVRRVITRKPETNSKTKKIIETEKIYYCVIAGQNLQYGL